METPEIFEEFEQADSTEQRRRVLERHELGWTMPDVDLPHYYRVDPEAVREYVDLQLKLFAQWDDVPEIPEFWAFVEDHDPEYAAELFRKTCRPEDWKARVTELSSSLSGDELVHELESIHPEAHGGFTGAEVFEMLLREHGDAVREYVYSHVAERWSGDGWDSLVELIADNEDWQLWDAIVSGQASREIDKHVWWVLERADERPGWARQRLAGIAGASYITWDGFSTARLGDEIATRVYRRFPNVLKSSLDEHVHVHRIRPRDHGFETLAAELQHSGDLAYLDRLAGKMLSVAVYIWGDTNHYESTFEHFVEHYRGIVYDSEYVRRASRVLSAFQPDDQEHWYTLRQNNPLYDVFFEQPERFSARPEVITDLLESSFFAVRSLGYRALTATGDRCGELAADNVGLVLAAPLDRLSAPGMRAALTAIRAMVAYEPSLGSVVLSRLRAAATLAYPSFSKGDLVRTMGQILRQSPELRRASEQSVIYDQEPTEGGHW